MLDKFHQLLCGLGRHYWSNDWRVAIRPGTDLRMYRRTCLHCSKLQHQQKTFLDGKEIEQGWSDYAFEPADWEIPETSSEKNLC